MLSPKRTKFRKAHKGPRSRQRQGWNVAELWRLWSEGDAAGPDHGTSD